MRQRTEIGVGLLILYLTCAVFGNPVEQRQQRANAIDSVGEIKASIMNNYGRGRRAAIGSVGTFITGEMHTYGGHGNRHKKPGHEAIGSIENMFVGNMVNPPVGYSTPEATSATTSTFTVPPPPSSTAPPPPPPPPLPEASVPDNSNNVPDFVPLESTLATPEPTTTPTPTPSNDTSTNNTYDNSMYTGSDAYNSSPSSTIPNTSDSSDSIPPLSDQNSNVVTLPASTFTGDPSDKGSIELVPFGDNSGVPPGQGSDDSVRALKSRYSA